MMSEKRESERLPILGELQGEIMTFEPMRVREISGGGASIETRFPLQIDSVHELRLTLGERSVVVKGRVVHSRISDVEQEVITYRTGVEFVDLAGRVTAVITTFLDAVKESRHSSGNAQGT